jgi:hypothetical protein
MVVGSFGTSGKTGLNKLHLQGRLSSAKTLKPGTYAVGLDFELRFLPLLVEQQPEQYESWARRWLSRWLDEAPNPSPSRTPCTWWSLARR